MSDERIPFLLKGKSNTKNSSTNNGTAAKPKVDNDTGSRMDKSRIGNGFGKVKNGARNENGKQHGKHQYAHIKKHYENSVYGADVDADVGHEYSQDAIMEEIRLEGGDGGGGEGREGGGRLDVESGLSLVDRPVNKLNGHSSRAHSSEHERITQQNIDTPRIPLPSIPATIKKTKRDYETIVFHKVPDTDDDDESENENRQHQIQDQEPFQHERFQHERLQTQRFQHERFQHENGYIGENNDLLATLGYEDEENTTTFDRMDRSDILGHLERTGHVPQIESKGGRFQQIESEGGRFQQVESEGGRDTHQSAETGQSQQKITENGRSRHVTTWGHAHNGQIRTERGQFKSDSYDDLETQDDDLRVEGREGKGQGREELEDSHQAAAAIWQNQSGQERSPLLCAEQRSRSSSTDSLGLIGDGGEGEEDSNAFAFFRLTSRKRGMFILLAISNFFACTCFSLLAPFFPAEAQSKGMSQTVIGLVFSCFELCVFLTSPFYGNFITKIGPKFAFVVGQFMAGCCSILFGPLYMCPPGLPFIVLCFVLRIVQALGASAYVTASFALIANEFSSSVATVFGILEIFAGLGYTAGPLFGGILYEAGGFGMPFYVMGTLLISCSCVAFFYMPSKTDIQNRRPKTSVLRLIASPLVIVSCFSVVVGTYNFGYMDATLATHLALFKLSPTVVGLMFVVVSTTYSIFAPFWGWLCDRKNIQYPLLIGGNTITCVSLLLMGPTPLLPLKAELWLVILSLAVMGPAIGATVTPTLKCFYKGASAFLGPMIGSAVLEATNYGWAATFNAGICLLSACCLVTYIAVEKFCLKYDDEKERRQGPE